MTSVRRPPSAAPSAATTRTQAPAAQPARTNQVTQVSRAEVLNRAELARIRSTQAPVAPTPGSWRGGANTEVGRAIQTMRSRLSDVNISIKGDTPQSLFDRAILDNKHVTNEQILEMSKVTLEQLATDPKDRAKVLEKVPNARELPVHKFTVAMLSAVTGIDRAKLSEACPDLGLTGAPGTPLLYAAKTERMQRSTALHDFTDYMRGAGVKGMNKAVWGVENRILSAIVSAAGGGRY
ncbi:MULTISPECIES: hypothetical protein [unclassified Corallococcus]|uniref:hypothetical protein n=2 Tax=Corallococcus TaxID=83461 RepID=UPI000EA108EA|nr:MULTISPECIES: hypothetical protein [unclassified Corallococcus]RKH09038.1 hypothetical protein D7X74_30365 [Corallococcus sp. CA047B]RKH24160.1 hypothetical protein D7X75_32420 [Corallococcus sp. CA031C]